MSLKCFISKLDLSGNQIIETHIKWLGSKIELLELSLALYEGNFVGSEHGELSKKDFMRHMSIITGVEIENYEQMSYKLKNREKRTRFIDKLKSILERMDSDD